MKKTLFNFWLLLLVLPASGQEKLLTIRDAMLNYRTSLAPENLRGLQFIYGSPNYVYLKRIGKTDIWLKGDLSSGKETEYLSLVQLNQKLKLNSLDTLRSMPSIQFSISKDWIFSANGNKLKLNPITNKASIIIPKEIAYKQNVEESAAGNIAYLDDNNLFISTATGTIQVTTDGSKDIVYASSVHREEFGITKGTFWSNDGKKLAFYRMDQSMVSDYPILDWAQRPAKNRNIKYPMAGDKSHHVTLGVYNTETKALVYLKTGEPAEQYLTNIAWSPDDRYIYIAVVNRAQNHMKLNQYDALNGNFVKTLFEERDDRYTEPLVPMLFLKNNSSQFIWQSNRDGWNHLYLYNSNGKLNRQLTKGRWEVTELEGFDKKGENLFYISTEDSPVTRNLYSVNLKTGKTKRITPGSYYHQPSISSDGKYVLDSYSSTTIPMEIQLVETATGKSKLLLKSANPLANYALGETNIFTIKNKGGDSIYCSMRKPINFDPAKKYPVIVYWYGGPHAQLVFNSWNTGAGDYWFQYMAEREYITLVMDTRGSDNRGKAFEQSMFRKAGDVQMEDMLSAVEYLKNQPYADTANMGLFGWSFGGFNTIDFMLTYPGVFKAAVAGGPVTDWKYYEVMYTERYMDTPQENPDGYVATDLKTKIEKLQGKLLLIHGLQDDVVVQQHSVELVKAAVDKGIQLDYMIYPGHGHNVSGKDRAHLYQKVSDYFMDHLK